jgi:hypothetical protein
MNVKDLALLGFLWSCALVIAATLVVGAIKVFMWVWGL